MNLPAQARSPGREDATLVVPVYNALEESIACIGSLLESDAGRCTILVHDDGSASYVGDALQARFGAVPNVILRTNFRNRGYTANVAYGVRSAQTPYVAVINSDTVFPRHWLGRLLESLDEGPHLAAVGPLSNAATFQSIPDLLAPDGQFSTNPDVGSADADRERIQGLLGGMFGGLSADVPILNGFCTVFRTAAVQEAGGFDAVSFPFGYGEENDLCMRLLAGGWRLAVRTDCFVYHAKSRSFGAQRKAELSRIGRETLARLYGEALVPEFAKLLEGHPVLGAVRFSMKAALRAPRGDGVGDPVSAGDELVVLEGPCVATIWPDRHVVSPAKDTGRQSPHMLGLLLGRNLLRVEVPAGRRLAFAPGAALETALGVVAAWSHDHPVVVSRLPAPASGSPVHGIAAQLRFSLLYYQADLGPDGPEPADPAVAVPDTAR